MNKDNAKQFLPLVQAMAEGKTIQLNLGYEWKDSPELVFDGAPAIYRIKPERRSMVAVYREGKHQFSTTKEELQKYSETPGLEFVEMVEKV